jgi:hypothetical protein
VTLLNFSPRLFSLPSLHWKDWRKEPKVSRTFAICMDDFANLHHRMSYMYIEKKEFLTPVSCSYLSYVRGAWVDLSTLVWIDPSIQCEYRLLDHFPPFEGNLEQPRGRAVCIRSSTPYASEPFTVWRKEMLTVHVCVYSDAQYSATVLLLCRSTERWSTYIRGN